MRGFRSRMREKYTECPGIVSASYLRAFQRELMSVDEWFISFVDSFRALFVIYYRSRGDVSIPGRVPWRFKDSIGFRPR